MIRLVGNRCPPGDGHLSTFGPRAVTVQWEPGFLNDDVEFVLSRRHVIGSGEQNGPSVKQLQQSYSPISR